MALRLILANSKNFDDMLDRIHSLADVDHLIAERIVYVKSQEAENLTKDINHDVSANSQNKVNYVNQVMIDCQK